MGVPFLEKINCKRVEHKTFWKIEVKGRLPHMPAAAEFSHA
jgi:hypothetical protein